MTTALLTILAGVLTANPLPDNKSSIDSLSYTFGDGGELGGGGTLRITTDGKVSYHYSSAPFTGSGGRVVQKSWTLSKEERTELFRKLVDDGLLEAEAGGHFSNEIRVTHGRWRTTLVPDKVPDKAMAHLYPLLSKADPVKWPEKKPVVAKEPTDKPGVLTAFHYNFSTKADGDHATLIVSRDGKVLYVRNSPNAAKPIREEWTIPAKDAAALLDALVADGLFDLEDAGRDKFHSHSIDVAAGKWRTNFYLKELPEKFLKPLLPLLRKADAEFWK
jgi:hypothetical protein